MSGTTFGVNGRIATGKYQLDVTASDVLDLVRSAGGWLVDRSMAGWDVNVRVAGGCDPRPLRILGITAGPREPEADPWAPAAAVALAASAEAVSGDPRLRADVLRAMKRRPGDALVWGPWRPSGSARGMAVVEHELSAAARAFKACALEALGVRGPVGATEAFLGRAASRAGYSDLTPCVATSLAQR